MREETASSTSEGRPAATAGDLLHAFRPLQPTRLADRVVDQVQRLVLDEGLAPGERLPSERDLAARLGTSRAIVSQALRTLSLMGLVEVRPGSGAYVTRNPEAMFVASTDLLLRSQDESLHALAELRFWLESMGANRALESTSPLGTGEIDQAFARLEASAGSTSEWVAADSMFHAAVVRAAGNPYLGPLYEAVHTSLVSVLYDRWVEREVAPAWLTGASWQHQIDLHRPIVDAVHAGDAGRLQEALRRHHDSVLVHVDQRHAGVSERG